MSFFAFGLSDFQRQWCNLLSGFCVLICESTFYLKSSFGKTVALVTGCEMGMYIPKLQWWSIVGLNSPLPLFIFQSTSWAFMGEVEGRMSVENIPSPFREWDTNRFVLQVKFPSSETFDTHFASEFPLLDSSPWKERTFWAYLPLSKSSWPML